MLYNLMKIISLYIAATVFTVADLLGYYNRY